MARGRSIDVKGDALGNVIITGDHNRTDARISVSLQHTKLPDPASVNVLAELRAIRSVLAEGENPSSAKIGRAFDDAEEEASKGVPNKDEIGSALDRALSYAQKADGIVVQSGELAQHIKAVVSWLGENWYKLLPLVGLIH